MQSLHEFILLRAMYNGELSDCIFKRDQQGIIDELSSKYGYELHNGLVRYEAINTNELYNQHIAEIEALNNNPELLQIYL